MIGLVQLLALLQNIEQRLMSIVILLQTRRAYTNARLSNPSSVGELHLRHLLRQTHFTIEERLAALKGESCRVTLQNGSS